MGTRGPSATRVLSGAGYWIAPPPITQDRAGAILGAAIPAETWAAMERAFADHEATMALIRGTTSASAAKGQRDRAARTLGDALTGVKALHGDGAILSQITQAATVAGAADTDLRAHLRAAALALRAAQRIVNAADAAPTMRVPTEGVAKGALAKRLRTVLRKAGLPSALSDRRSLPSDAAESDLTPFERLLSEAGVHVAETPAALAKWAAGNTR